MTEQALELDVGNSRVKWRLRNLADNSVGPVSFASHNDIQTRQAELLAQFMDVSIIKAATVASSLFNPLMELAEHLKLPIQFARTVQECAGVRNSYADPSFMGVDRWLAMIAAFNDVKDQAGRDVCVIDCGTSLTIDFVSASGAHIGGLIMPGRCLILQSLQQNTEQVLFDPQSDSYAMALGKSTQEAVLNGVVHLLVGAVHQSLDQHLPQAASCACYLAGGDAELLRQHLRVDVSVVPDLVLDGLRYSLP